MTHWFHVLGAFPTQRKRNKQDADGYCPLFCWHLRSASNERLVLHFAELLGKEGTEIDTHNAKGWEAWSFGMDSYSTVGFSPALLLWNVQVKGQCMKKWSGYCREENWKLLNSMNFEETSSVFLEAKMETPVLCKQDLKIKQPCPVWFWLQDEQCKTISHAKGESGDPTYVWS